MRMYHAGFIVTKETPELLRSSLLWNIWVAKTQREVGDEFFHLTSKGITCQTLKFWMTASLACHISFIQSLFLTKIVVLDSSSNLFFVVKISAQSKIS